MTDTDTAFERRVTETLHRKVAQLPPVTIDLEAAPMLPTEEPRRTRRSRALIAATIALVLLLVAAGITAAVRTQDESALLQDPPRERIVARLRIEAFPTLRFQAREFTTVAGLNEITLVQRGGSEGLVFDDPALSRFTLSVPNGRSVGTVKLEPGRDYRIHSPIPGHTEAGMEAVIHVLPTGADGNLPLPRAVLDEVSEASQGTGGPAHGRAQYVLASRNAANRALLAAEVFDEHPVYVFLLRGSFFESRAGLDGMGGDTLTLVITRDSIPSVLDSGLGPRLRSDLATVGGVMTARY